MDPLQFRLRIFLIIFIGVLLLGIFGFMAIEGMSLFNAFYFSIVTVATVGYGDLYPTTPLGKVVGGLIIILGVATFALPTAILTSGFVDELQRRREEKEAKEKESAEDGP